MINIKSKNEKIISGGLHYCRIINEEWRDRLEKLRNLGCNTVETYIPWNFHEYNQGEFDFCGDRNIREFIKTAQECGLEVIVRIGPYICAEWEFGGFPSWILKNKGIRLRSNDPIYLENIEKWWSKLFEEIGDLQESNNGPIIMVQIENEYGYYANDKEHLNHLHTLALELGWNCQIFTSDGLFDHEGIIAGNLIEKDVLPTLNMGGAVEARHERFRKLFGDEIPFFNMEYWVGWFNFYGQPHLFRSPEASVDNYIKALEYGHTNIYVFNGGTNFGYYAGANEVNNRIEATITSYDYDGILTESGERSHKYDVFREAISKYVDNKDDIFPESERTYLNGIELPITSKVDMFSTYKPTNTKYGQYPYSQEDIEQIKGFTLYSTTVDVLDNNVKKIKLNNCNDRALIFVNDQYITTQYESLGEVIEIKFVANQKNKLDILVENLGRVNLHQTMDYQTKGICHSIQINEHIHTGIATSEINLEELYNLDISSSSNIRDGLPMINNVEFILNEVGDTYLDISKFGKGYVLVNGFNIGAYWKIGPQTRLYIPKQKLNIGSNKIMIFDIEGHNVESVKLYKEQLWTSTKYEI